MCHDCRRLDAIFAESRRVDVAREKFLVEVTWRGRT